MNKYQEALNNLLLTARKTEDIRIIQELVDKETPMKPQKTEYGDYLCGKCGWLVWEAYTPEKHERCSGKECGQVVDWSNE